ncbi:MAG: molybdopterin-guanine dinucleotide biosynthesis protein A, partial [Pseudohongiellaceae bacterium]
FCGLYHRDLLPTIQQRMDEGERSLRGLLKACDILAVPLSELPVGLSPASLFDVDTPADLARAQELCAL